MQGQKIVKKESQELIENNISFAKKLAKKFYKSRTSFNIEYEEYQSSAYIGLCSAARRFDVNCGVDFRSYAYYRIVGAMSDMLRRGGFDCIKYSIVSENKGVKLATGEKRKQKKVYHKMSKDIKGLIGIVNSNDNLGMKIHYFVANQNENTVQISYAKQLDPESVVIKSSLKNYVNKLVESLPAKEKHILQAHYFEEKSFSKIRRDSKQLTRSWISRMHARSLDLLREEIENYQNSCNQRLATHAC